MSFTKDDVNKLAHLARLSLAESTQDKPNEKKFQSFDLSIADDLNNILQMVDQINEINTDGIEPMAHPMDASQRLRPDEVTEPNNREALQALTKETHKEDGLYLVPIVVE